MRVWAEINETTTRDPNVEEHVDEGSFLHIEYGHHIRIPYSLVSALQDAIDRAAVILAKDHERKQSS